MTMNHLAVLFKGKSRIGSAARISAQAGGQLMTQSSLRGEDTGTPLSVTVSWTRERATVMLAGDLDVTSVQLLRDAVQEVTLRPARIVCLDLTALLFADLAGIRTLQWACQQLTQHPQKVHITGIQPPIQRILDLTGITLAATQ
jgi:anti-anti-sigma factor